MPNWLITVLLVIVLAWLTYKTVLKGTQLHQSEKEGQAVAACDASAESDANQAPVTQKSAVSNVNGNAEATCIVDIGTSQPAISEVYNTMNLMDHDAHLRHDDAQQLNGDTDLGQDEDIAQILSDQLEPQQPYQSCMCIPWKVVQFAELTLLWSAFLTLQYWKTKYSQCSWQFAVLCSAQGIFSLCATAASIYQSHALRSSGSTELQEALLDDQKQIASHHDWSLPVLLRCVAVTLLGGTVAGMLGFGGGMILNPLMLEMGIHPLVSSATSSVMVLFSASTATFAFAVNGRLNYQYAAVYGGVCAVASAFGVVVISTSVRRSGKGSLIVFILAMIIGTGAVLQAVFGGIAVVQDVKSGRHLSFSSWC